MLMRLVFIVSEEHSAMGGRERIGERIGMENRTPLCEDDRTMG